MSTCPDQGPSNDCVLFALARAIQYQLNGHIFDNANFKVEEIVKQIRLHLDISENQQHFSVRRLCEALERKPIRVTFPDGPSSQGQSKDSQSQDLQNQASQNQPSVELGCTIKVVCSNVDSFDEGTVVTGQHKLVVSVPMSLFGAVETDFVLRGEPDLITRACTSSLATYLLKVVEDFRQKGDTPGCVLVQDAELSAKSLRRIKLKAGWPPRDQEASAPEELTVPVEVIRPIYHVIAAEKVVQVFDPRFEWAISCTNSWGRHRRNVQLKKGMWNEVWAYRVAVELDKSDAAVDQGLTRHSVKDAKETSSSSQLSAQHSSSDGDGLPPYDADLFSVVPSASECCVWMASFWKDMDALGSAELLCSAMQRWGRELQREDLSIGVIIHCGRGDRNAINTHLKQLKTAKGETVGSIFFECKQEFLKARRPRFPKAGNKGETVGKDQEGELAFTRLVLDCMYASAGEAWSPEALKRLAEKACLKQSVDHLLETEGIAKGLLILSPSGKVQQVGARASGQESLDWQALNAAHFALPKDKMWNLIELSKGGMRIYYPFKANDTVLVRAQHVPKRDPVIHGIASVICAWLAATEDIQTVAKTMRKHLAKMDKEAAQRCRSSIDQWCGLWNKHRSTCRSQTELQHLICDLNGIHVQCSPVESFEAAKDAASRHVLLIHFAGPEEQLVMLSSDAKHKEPQDFVPMRLKTKDNGMASLEPLAAEQEGNLLCRPEDSIISISHCTLVSKPLPDLASGVVRAGKHSKLWLTTPWGGAQRDVMLTQKSWEALLSKECGALAFALKLVEEEPQADEDKGHEEEEQPDEDLPEHDAGDQDREQVVQKLEEARQMLSNQLCGCEISRVPWGRGTAARAFLQAISEDADGEEAVSLLSMIGGSSSDAESVKEGLGMAAKLKGFSLTVFVVELMMSGPESQLPVRWDLGDQSGQQVMMVAYTLDSRSCHFDVLLGPKRASGGKGGQDHVPVQVEVERLGEARQMLLDQLNGGYEITYIPPGPNSAGRAFLRAIDEDPDDDEAGFLLQMIRAAGSVKEGLGQAAQLKDFSLTVFVVELLPGPARLLAGAWELGAQSGKQVWLATYTMNSHSVHFDVLSKVSRAPSQQEMESTPEPEQGSRRHRELEAKPEQQIQQAPEEGKLQLLNQEDEKQGSVDEQTQPAELARKAWTTSFSCCLRWMGWRMT